MHTINNLSDLQRYLSNSLGDLQEHLYTINYYELIQEGTSRLLDHLRNEYAWHWGDEIPKDLGGQDECFFVKLLQDYEIQEA